MGLRGVEACAVEMHCSEFGFVVYVTLFKMFPLHSGVNGLKTTGLAFFRVKHSKQGHELSNQSEGQDKETTKRTEHKPFELCYNSSLKIAETQIPKLDTWPSGKVIALIHR